MTKSQSQDPLDELKRIIDVGVPASVRATWPIFYPDGSEGEAGKDPEYVAEHFHKYWTPSIRALISTAVAEALDRVEREIITAQDRKEYWPVWRKELIERQRTTLSKIKAEYTGGKTT